jgi:hypothetical protein
MLIHAQLLRIPVVGSGQVVAVVAVVSSLSGCAIIENIHPDGTYERSIALAAPLIIAPAPAGQSSFVRVTGLGVGGANNTAALGWFDETVATLGPDCRVVLIGNTEQELRSFAALLPKNEAICSDSKLNGGQK